MNLYDLQERFWQLEEEQPFSPAAAKLFFYWLRRFNKERYKPTLPRSEKQVAADLTMDATTVATARKQLVNRGVMTFVPGDRSRTALWGMGTDSPKVEPKNSAQPAADNNGDEPKNSAQVPGNNPDSPEDEPKNSAPYKEGNLTCSGDNESPSGARTHEVAAEKSSPQPENTCAAAEPKGGAARAPRFQPDEEKLPADRSPLADQRLFDILVERAGYSGLDNRAYRLQMLATAQDKHLAMPARSWSKWVAEYLNSENRNKKLLLAPAPGTAGNAKGGRGLGDTRKKASTQGYTL